MGGSLWSEQWLSGNIWSQWNDADCPSPTKCTSNPEYVPKNMEGQRDMWLWPAQPSSSSRNDLFQWIRIWDVPWDERAGHAAVAANGRVYITAGSDGNHLYSDVWCYGCDDSPSPSPTPPPHVPGKVIISTWVLIAIVGGSVVSVLILILVVRRTGKGDKDAENPFAYRRAASMSPRRLNSEEQALERMLHASHESSEWLLDRSNIILKEEIARGSSGWIFKGTFHNAEVAVKQLRMSHWDDSLSRKSIFSEIGILSRVRHPNIVRMYGTWCSSVKRENF